MERFDGLYSIKNTRLTNLVYATMKEAVRRPRLLAVACWVDEDFEAVSGGTQSHSGNTVIAFWAPGHPRWLHISAAVCRDFQSLVDSKRPTGRRASSLVTALHEAVHAYGIRHEAQTNCFAVQLVEYATRRLGMTHTQAKYMAKLARNYTRRTAPNGYWNSSRCRDGGAWDLEPNRPNL